MFTWVKGNVYTLVLILYLNNITLNSSAASYFEDVCWAMTGLDKDSLRLGIRPVTKREIDLYLVSMDQLYKVSVGKGYARIGNKTITEEIPGMTNQPINELKVNVAYDETENMLIADLHELAVDKGRMDYGADLDYH